MWLNIFCQPSDHKLKSHSMNDRVSTTTFPLVKFYSTGACCEITGTSLRRLSSQSTSSSSPFTDICIDIDDPEPIIEFVFETTGASLIDIQALEQQANVSIETIESNNFKVRGSRQHCCKLLDILRAREQSRSPRMSSKKIPIESQDQWGMIIGTKGRIHKAIMKLSGAKVKIDDSESYPKMCTIRGFCGQVMAAEKLIQRALKGEDIVTEATPESILACLKRDLEIHGAFKFRTS